MNFMNSMKNYLDSNTHTYTENGAVAFATSGKKLLDFNFATTALRKETDDNIAGEFSKVYFENPIVAVQYLFWLRDCRGGNGERRIFRVCFKWLAENKPEIARATIKFIPEFGRYDDLYCVADTQLKDDAFRIIRNQFDKDLSNAIHGKQISLLSKWLKSENSSSKESRRLARMTMDYLNLNPRRYRKTLSRLRKHLDVVERKMAGKEWDMINYSTVPSQANVKYSAAFLRNDEERRKEYLNSLKRGETKINATTLQPHEIVAKYKDGYGLSRTVRQYDEALEQLWKALPSTNIGNTLVVRDSSGSMLTGYGAQCCPLDVATALAIYAAEHNDGIWKDKYITFSSNPRFIDLSGCSTLRDKLVLSFSESEVANTDIEKTMLLILNTAIANHCTQDEMPKNILILSDLQFDSMVTIRGNRKALFENLISVYEDNGYKMPRIIFWNLSGSVNNTIPIQNNDLGVVLCSGFSIQLLKMIMSGKTDPYEVLLETINSERYLPIKEAVQDLV